MLRLRYNWGLLPANPRNDSDSDIGTVVITLADVWRCGINACLLALSHCTVSGTLVVTPAQVWRCGVSARTACSVLLHCERNSSAYPGRRLALWGQMPGLFALSHCTVSGTLVVTLADVWRCGFNARTDCSVSLHCDPVSWQV